MTGFEALELLRAPFVEYSAWEKARDRALAVATPNQRALYEKIPSQYRGGYLRGLLMLHKDKGE